MITYSTGICKCPFGTPRAAVYKLYWRLRRRSQWSAAKSFTPSERRGIILLSLQLSLSLSTRIFPFQNPRAKKDTPRHIGGCGERLLCLGQSFFTPSPADFISGQIVSFLSFFPKGSPTFRTCKFTLFLSASSQQVESFSSPKLGLSLSLSLFQTFFSGPKFFHSFVNGQPSQLPAQLPV